MATEGISKSNIVKGSNEAFEFLCSVCKRENRKTKAEMFCSVCNHYYCSSCVKCDDDTTALKNDQILDESTAELSAVLAECCKEHKLEPVYKLASKGSGDNTSQQPKRASPQSPKGAKKNLPANSQSSPKSNKKTTRRKKKNELYPDLPSADGENSVEEEEEDDNYNAIDGEDSANWENGVMEDHSPQRRVHVIDRPDLSNRDISDSSPNASRNERNLPKTNVRIDENVQSSSSFCPSFVLYVAVAFIAIGVILYIKDQPSESPLQSTASVDYYKLFKPQLEKVKARYPSQSPRFWKVVSSAIRRLLTEPEETYPAVLLFGVSKDSSHVGTCLAKDIVKTLNIFFNSSETGFINSVELDSTSEGKMKLDLDKRMMGILNVAKGVVVDHVEILPAYTALLFHGYCDGDNAPYKNATIILSVHSEKVVPDNSRVVEDVLNELWERDLGLDEMPALRSRIANNIAIISPEQHVSC